MLPMSSIQALMVTRLWTTSLHRSHACPGGSLVSPGGLALPSQYVRAARRAWMSPTHGASPYVLMASAHTPQSACLLPSSAGPELRRGRRGVQPPLPFTPRDLGAWVWLPAQGPEAELRGSG